MCIFNLSSVHVECHLPLILFLLRLLFILLLLLFLFLFLHLHLLLLLLQFPRLPHSPLLRELHLAGNSLSSLSPVAEAWLPLLQVLSVAGNCLSSVPCLSCLVSLTELDLSNNPIYGSLSLSLSFFYLKILFA